MSTPDTGFDELARYYYSAGDYKSASIFGARAVDSSPEDARLQQNLRWYNSALDKRAYITLLSNNNYINGVVVLDQSLKLLKSKYLLYCVVTPDVSSENLEVLNKLNIPTILKDTIIPIQYADMEAKDINSLDERGWHRALTKLSIFGLEEFSRLVYIDADIIVKQNIDELFDKQHMTACWDGGLDLDTDGFSGSFNSGLMVIEPNRVECSKIIDFMNNFDAKGSLIHDQLILQEYYKEWPSKKDLHLSRWYAPWTTNFNPGHEQYYYYLRGNIKTLHMIDRKPWNESRQYYYDLLNAFPFYSLLNLEYIDILNYTILSLQKQDITSPDLKVIE